jgi:TonB-linked SusC/RagA family outer membrane protein
MKKKLINGMKNGKLKKMKQMLLLSAFILVTGAGMANAATAYPSPETTESQQSKISITGTVVDRTGEAVIGANIVEKGGAVNGTITDADGNFSIGVSPGATLTVSFIGYVTQEIAVRNQTQLQIILQEDLQILDEVVVIGYGTQTKKSLTAAVSTMDMSSIEANTHSTVSHALQGKAAGLRVVQTSAQPAGASSFRIRGETSINAGNDPLFVIDGVPISPSGSPESAQQYFQDGKTDNFLESLNPDDIESISVLKDAASTAIYGARAGHGVILITTKRGGKSQKPQLNYSGNYSIQTMDRNYLLLNPQQYMQVANMQDYEQYLVNYGLDIYRDYITSSSQPAPFQPRYSANDIANATGTDWFKEVTRTGALQQHNLSLTGGTETTRYLTSLNYMNQDGVIKNSAASRFAARINLDHDVNKYLTVGISANYAQNIYDNIAMGTGMNEYSGVIMAAYQANPLNPIYNDDGTFYIDPRRAQVDNPVALLEIEDITHKERLIASGYVTVKPFKGLSLKAMFGGDKKINRRSNYTPKTTLNGAFTNGWASKSSSNATDYLTELTATYDKTIGNHKFNVLGGYSFQKFTSESMSASNRDFLFDSFSYNNLAAGAWATPGVGSGYGVSSIYSWFGRIHYSFNDRYLVEGSLRADGSSNFTKENSVGVFPAVSAGWVISEEPFMESTKDWLSNVKLRASYGQTGNESVGRHVSDYFNAASWLSARMGLSENIGISVLASELGNPDLTWETTTEMNIGIDAGFINNRFRLSAEYFDRRVSNLLTTRTLPSHNEVLTIYDNIGVTGSKGFEITVNSVNLTTRNFEWTSTLTLSHHRDRWIEHFPEWIPQPYEGPNDLLRAIYEYRSLGLLQPGQQPPASQLALLPGGIVIADLSGPNGEPDGVINDYDKVYMGASDPALIYGLNNAVRYHLSKKLIFDFNIYFYGESGLTRYGSYKRGDVYTTSGGQNATIGAFDSFRHDNLDSTHPNIFGNSYHWGDHYVNKIYYIRCGNLTLGCTLPVTKVVEKVRVYVDVGNPFIITNYEGLDPETEGSGGTAYPNVKSFNLGVNITF